MNEDLLSSSTFSGVTLEVDASPLSTRGAGAGEGLEGDLGGGDESGDDERAGEG